MKAEAVLKTAEITWIEMICPFRDVEGIAKVNEVPEHTFRHRL